MSKKSNFDVFTAALPGALFQQALESATLEGRLDRIAATAARRWATLRFDQAGFLRHLAQRVSHPLDQSLRLLRTSDIALAFACAEGDSNAIRLFEGLYFSEIDNALARLHLPVEPSEARQAIRDRLFVRRGALAPRIGEYAGRGMLANWFRISVFRTLVNWKKQSEIEFDQALALYLLPRPTDPERLHAIARHRGDIESALHAAIGTLDSGDRRLLKFVLRGLTIDQVAYLQRVHRATAARRLSAVRSRLLDSFCREMFDRMRVSRDEALSFLRLVRSQLDQSWIRLLSESGAALEPSPSLIETHR